MFTTTHFSMSEFTRSDTAKRLKLKNTPDAVHHKNLERLMRHMDVVRQMAGSALVITSGYRSPEVNAAVGGVADSDHALGHACDFYAPAVPITKLAKLLAEKLRTSDMPFDQFILETSRGVCHLSLHPRSRRQVLTQRGAAHSKIVKGIVL